MTSEDTLNQHRRRLLSRLGEIDLQLQRSIARPDATLCVDCAEIAERRRR